VRTCTYISGPPCAGKSTVAGHVLRQLPGLQHLVGDRFWVARPDLPFPERVDFVNRSLLDALRDASGSDVLCEWVPCTGEFVAAFHQVCVDAARCLIHVIVTAPEAVRRERKLRRDGDVDLGPPVSPEPPTDAPCECVTVDTVAVDPVDISSDVCSRIRAAHLEGLIE